MKARSVSKDVKLAVLAKIGSPGKAVVDDSVPSWGIDSTRVVSALGGPHLGKGLGPAQTVRNVVALRMCSACPGQVGDVWVTEGSIKGSTPQEEGEGKQVEDSSQSSSGA